MDAVKAYKIRRRQRLEKRFGPFRLDADEETNNNSGKKGGHGNTRIPFGLCQREGIQAGKDWTPKDAWEALAGKGYSANDVYKSLKETGKVGGKSGAAESKAGKPKRPPTTIKAEDFPGDMVSKTFRKNTMVAADYISGHCDDGDITDLLASANGAGASAPPKLTCKRSTDGSGCSVSREFFTFGGGLAGVVVTVPMFSSYKDEDEKNAAIASFAHEWAHFLDHSASGWEKDESFSKTHKKLSGALAKETEIKISDEVRAVFDDFKKQYEAGKKRANEEYRDVRKNLMQKRYGSNRPDWLDENGGYVYNSSFWGQWEEREAFEKAARKAESDCKKAWNRKKRSYVSGACQLQGIYDSLYEGKCRSQKIVLFGHSESYFRSHSENRAMEVLADYVALKAVNPQMVSILAKDKPELVEALDDCVVSMTKKLRGGS